MPTLQEIISVTIDRQTTGIPRAGFGVPLLLSTEATTVFGPELARAYTSLDAMVLDGFAAAGAAATAVARIFGQNPSVDRIIVGKRSSAPQKAVRLIPAEINSTLYTVTVNGVDFTFTSDSSATSSEIASGLETAINGGGLVNVTADATSTPGELVISNTVAGAPFTFSASRELFPTQSDETTAVVGGVTTDLTALRTAANGSDEWYALLLDTHDEDSILDAASYIEGLEKIFLAGSGDTDNLGTGGTSIVEQIAAANYDRTAVFYHDDIDDFPEAAWAGRVLNIDPGGETWAYKQLAGIAAASLSTTEITNLEASNANIYVEQTRNTPITRFGTMGSGEYIDIMRFVDFIAARIRENIFLRLVNLNKIPFTDRGIAIVEAEIRGVLQTGIASGGFAADPAPVVTAPRAADVSANDKANRILPDVKFQATLSGAIHKVEVRGTVSL